MKAIELFAGVGGFRIGLERAGHEVIWSNEWDKYACDTYDYNFDVPVPSRGEQGRLDSEAEHSTVEHKSVGVQQSNISNRGHKIDRRDITTIPTSDIPDHDILVGGFPCQAFSVAGKRKGFDEARGTLFFDVARILADKRPRYFILENVKGLLSHDSGKTFQTILGVLTDIGYEYQWQVLNSKNHGVPQNRERIVIVGHLRGEPRPQVFPLGNDNETSFGLPGQQSNTLTTRYYGGQANGTYVAEREHNAQNDTADRPNSRQNTSQSDINSESRGAKAAPHIRRLTPIECERLQAFPDNHTKYGLKPDGTIYEMSDTQRYKQMGNAVTTNVIEAVARLL